VRATAPRNSRTPQLFFPACFTLHPYRSIRNSAALLNFPKRRTLRAGMPVDTVSELRHDPEVALRGELAEVQDRGADRRSRL